MLCSRGWLHHWHRFSVQVVICQFRLAFVLHQPWCKLSKNQRTVFALLEDSHQCLNLQVSSFLDFFLSDGPSFFPYFGVLEDLSAAGSSTFKVFAPWLANKPVLVPGAGLVYSKLSTSAKDWLREGSLPRSLFSSGSPGRNSSSGGLSSKRSDLRSPSSR